MASSPKYKQKGPFLGSITLLWQLQHVRHGLGDACDENRREDVESKRLSELELGRKDAPHRLLFSSLSRPSETTSGPLRTHTVYKGQRRCWLSRIWCEAQATVGGIERFSSKVPRGPFSFWTRPSPAPAHSGLDFAGVQLTQRFGLLSCSITMGHSATKEQRPALLRVLEEGPKEDTAQVYPNGLPAICRLHLVSWKLIVAFLDLEDLMKLMATSNSVVALNVSRSVRKIHWHHLGPFIDLEAFLHCSKLFGRTDDGLTKVEEMLIEAVEPLMPVKRPLKSLRFPPSLTSLSLHCAAAYALLSDLNLPKVMPDLLHLSIKDVWTSKKGCSEFQLPPKLQSLCLRSQPYHPLHPEWIASLPSTLQSLTLDGVDGLWDPSRRPPVPYIWPPSLEHLALTTPNSILIENLPRTLTSLELIGVVLRTAFPKFENQFVFPWRRFFPYLYRLRLSGPPNQYSSLILRTIVLDDALDAATVDAFISSGFWDLPSLRHFQTSEGRKKEPYPHFKKLCIPPDRYEGKEGEDLVRELKTLSPLLRKADLGCIESASPDLMRSFELTRHWALPRKITHLPQLPPSVTSIDGTIIICEDCPPHLLEIDCYKLKVPKTQNSLPPNLTSLVVRGSVSKGSRVVELLPLTLTKLELALSGSEEWALVVERLVNLRILKVEFDTKWVNDKPVARISSHRLEELRLEVSFDEEDTHERPLMKEMFCAQPSIFPPSLRTLTLICEQAWHASILSVLPPSLTSLDIDNIAWPDANGEMLQEGFPRVPYPGSEAMDCVAIMKSLPPSLSILKHGRLSNSAMHPDFPNLLQYLPRSVTRIDTRFSVDAIGVPATLLPPYLIQNRTSKLMINVQNVRPPGFMN